MYSCSAMQFGKERNGIFSLLKTSDSFEARIRGVQNTMTSFNFYFGCTLGEQLLMQTDNLSCALQNSSTSAAQGNRLAQDVVKTLLTDRTDNPFKVFFGFGSYSAKLQSQSESVSYEVGEQDTHHFPETPKDHYRRIYFNAKDTVSNAMHRHKIWARRLQNLREHTGTPIEVFCQWAMWHWASRVGENVQRIFRLFPVKKTTFALTIDSRVNGVWHFRIWRQWFGNLLCNPLIAPAENY